MTNWGNGGNGLWCHHLNTAIIFIQSFPLIPIFYKAVSWYNAHFIFFVPSDEHSQGLFHIAALLSYATSSDSEEAVPWLP